MKQSVLVLEKWLHSFAQPCCCCRLARWCLGVEMRVGGRITHVGSAGLGNNWHLLAGVIAGIGAHDAASCRLIGGELW